MKRALIRVIGVRDFLCSLRFFYREFKYFKILYRRPRAKHRPHSITCVLWLNALIFLFVWSVGEIKKRD